MPHIQQLDPHVADLIAAGEVVERPASVVKELLENAIDAGASAVTVEIQRGGRSYIRVTDDGCGIAAGEAETAFLRHATSKLRDEHDLEAIGTLGFRGEALAAIAAVSKVELITREKGAELGVALTVVGGQPGRKEEAGGPEGTTMIVRDLFFNTPARLKFMRKDAAEGASVLSVVQNEALAHPEVSIRFLREGREELMTPGDGKLSSALYAVLGRDMALGFLPVKGSGEGITVEGFASMPACCRGTRGYQHFFVNGRYVKSRTMTAALEEAYKNQKMVGKFPGCVLHLTTRLSAVDVNVHPTKTEVKFQSDRELFDAVYYAVLSALDRDRTRPAVRLEGERLTPPAAQDTVTPNQTSILSPVPKGTPAAQPAAPTAPAAPSAPAGEKKRVENPNLYKPGIQVGGKVELHDTSRPKFKHSLDRIRRPGEARGVDIWVEEEPARRVSAPHKDKAPVSELPPVLAGLVTEMREEAARQQEPEAPKPREGPDRNAVMSELMSGILRRTAADNPRVVIGGKSVFEKGGELGGLFGGLTGRAAPEKNAPAEDVPKEEPVPEKPAAGEEESVPEALPEQKEEALPWRLAGEVLNTYLIVEQGENVLLIDKHAAHERMNFDRLKAQNYKPMSQVLLAPVVFTPAAEEGAALLDHLDLLRDFGFLVEDFGGGTLIVREVPYDIDAEETEATLAEIAGRLLTCGSADPSAARDEVLHTVACKAAIKGGQKNSREELLKVAGAVMRGEVKYCPHGRPVAIQLTRAQLEKQFKRA